MPGKYGPGGKWIHDRAQRIMEKGDVADLYGEGQGKQVAYAIATQQAHKLGKTPKKGKGPRGQYGTPEGKKMSLKKFTKDRDEYRKTAADRILEVKASLEKTASLPGQDMRNPGAVAGRFKPPTQDSLSYSSSLLNQSMADSGPMANPTPSKGATLSQLTPNYGTSKGSLPKTAAAETGEPLVDFLNKQAVALETNIGDGPKTEEVGPSEAQIAAHEKEYHRVLRELFVNEHRPPNTQDVKPSKIG